MFTRIFTNTAAAPASLGMMRIPLWSVLGAGLLAAALFLLLGPISCKRAADEAHTPSNGERQMRHSIPSSEADRQVHIPPIDRDIPADIQTATFALG
jgi:hypothetical protein